MKRKNTFPQSQSVQGVIATLFLVFFLGTSITVISDSYDRTLEESRKLTYGAWHIAVFDTQKTVSESLSDHAAVDSVGEMRLSGMVMSGENIIGGVGCLDEDLIQIGNITLLDGRFPSSVHEIAVEAAALTRLGYSLELGQKIQLSISDFDQSLHLQTPVTQEFILTGVIKNYASNWKSNSHWLVSYCVSEDFCENAETKLHVFGQLNSNFAQYADSLQPLTLDKGFFTKNDYTYLQYSEDPSTGSRSVILHTAIILSGCLSLVILINNELNRRKVSFVTMRIWGATKAQILRMFLKERFYAICLASGTGMIAGIIFPYMIVALANGFFEGDLYYQLLPSHILQIFLLSALGVILSLGLSMTRIFNTPLTGHTDQQVTLHAKRHRRKSLSRKNLKKLLEPSSRENRWISVVLTCASAVLVFFSAYEAWAVYKDYDYFRQNYPEDYAFGMIASYHEPTGHISAADLGLIRSTYGVKEVYAFSSSDYVGIDFSHEYDRAYANAAAQSIPQSVKDLPEAGAYGTVVGITDNLIPVYLSQARPSGGTLQDDEVILYIPDLYRDNDSVRLLEYEQAEPDKNLIVREKSMDAGQTIIIHNGEKQTELSIAGVIRSYSSDFAISFKLFRPYSVICNEQTYAKLFGECQYTYVLAYGDPTTIQYQTDVELSKLRTQLYFSNNRLFRAEKLQAFTIDLVLSLILLVASFTLSAMIRYGVQAHAASLERQKLLVLYRLGMSKRTMLRTFAVRAVKESLFGSFATFILFVAYRCFQERDILFSLSNYWETEPARIAADIISRCIAQTDWLFVLLALVLIACINFFILMFYNYSHTIIVCDN